MKGVADMCARGGGDAPRTDWHGRPLCLALPTVSSANLPGTTERRASSYARQELSIMWIVRLALRRPYTFVVMSILIAILGGISILTMPTDIFPNIDIPVVSVIETYPGVSPDEMEKRIVTITERAMTTTVNDIEHIESQSYNGVAVIKVYFQPNVKPELAIAQITSIVQTLLRALPPGIFPPAVVKHNASSVPILQLALNRDTLTVQQLYDSGLNVI